MVFVLVSVSHDKLQGVMLMLSGPHLEVWTARIGTLVEDTTGRLISSNGHNLPVLRHVRWSLHLLD
jgi:hypothetical protein